MKIPLRAVEQILLAPSTANVSLKEQLLVAAKHNQNSRIQSNQRTTNEMGMVNSSNSDFVIQPSSKTSAGNQNILREISQKRPHFNTNVHQSNDVACVEDGEDCNAFSSNNNSKKRKRMVPQALPANQLKSGQQMHVEKALALQSETNALLKVIISQNKNTNDLLNILVRK